MTRRVRYRSRTAGRDRLLLGGSHDEPRTPCRFAAPVPTAAMAEYQPGVCNIGAEQRRARRLSGIGSFGIAVAVVLAVALDVVPSTAVWATVPFVFGGWLGFLQDYFQFCVAFGALARYDLSGSGGDVGSVAEREAVRADRKRALTVLVAAAGLTVATSVPLVVLLA